MERLPTSFMGRGEVAGEWFVQLFRHEDLCLYVRLRNRVAFEIVRPRKQKGKIVNVRGIEVVFKEKERYPSGNEWGKFEFYIQELDVAIQRFNEQALGMGYDVVLTEEMIKAELEHHISVHQAKKLILLSQKRANHQE